MDINSAKVTVIIIQCVSSMLLGCLPYFLVKGQGQDGSHAKIRNRVISFLKCFSGGVFLAACLLHLLPEGLESMEDYFSMVDIDPDFPVYMVVVALGFFLIALVEQLAHTFIHRKHRVHDVIQLEGRYTSSNPLTNTTPPPYDDNEKSPNCHPNVQEKESAVCSNGHSVHAVTQEASNTQRVKQEVPHQAFDVEAATNNLQYESPHEMDHIISVITGGPLRAFLLLAALSFHTVFDGLAVGLQESHTDMWEMFTAVVIHKSLVSVCLGLQLFMVYVNRPIKGILWTLLFATITPIGIGVGMILTSDNLDNVSEQLVSSFLQGLATGTFLYVTFFEILREEVVDKRGFLRVLVVALGFVSLALLTYFIKD